MWRRLCGRNDDDIVIIERDNFIGSVLSMGTLFITHHAVRRELNIAQNIPLQCPVRFEQQRLA